MADPRAAAALFRAHERLHGERLSEYEPADKNLGELVFRLGRINQGVALLRLAGLTSARKAGLVVDARKHMPLSYRTQSVLSRRV